MILFSLPMAALLAASPVSQVATQVETAADAGVLEVPGLMTDAGRRFARRCDDEAFAQEPDFEKHVRFCQRLYARWWTEATAQAYALGKREKHYGTEPLGHPYLRAGAFHGSPPPPRSPPASPPPAPSQR